MVEKRSARRGPEAGDCSPLTRTLDVQLGKFAIQADATPGGANPTEAHRRRLSVGVVERTLAGLLVFPASSVGWPLLEYPCSLLVQWPIPPILVLDPREPTRMGCTRVTLGRAAFSCVYPCPDPHLRHSLACFQGWSHLGNPLPLLCGSLAQRKPPPGTLPSGGDGNRIFKGQNNKTFYG